MQRAGIAPMNRRIRYNKKRRIKKRTKKSSVLNSIKRAYQLNKIGGGVKRSIRRRRTTGKRKSINSRALLNRRHLIV